MNKLLTVCPTKNRPDKCAKMLESFEKTSFSSDVLFVLDDDERDIVEYIKLFKRYKACGNLECLFLKPSNITIQLNQVLSFSYYKDYDFYHITNDDFVYHTLGWDHILCDKIKGFGISYGNDLFVKEKLPTAPVISGNIVRALGWLQMPKLTHLYGDSSWNIIGRHFNKLYYCKDVIIEHQHGLKNKEYKDELFEHTNSQEMFAKDHKAMLDWIRGEYQDDIAKIKEMINES